MDFGTKQTSAQIKQPSAQTKQSTATKSTGDGPVGIGGWLILPVIGFVFVLFSFSPIVFNTLTSWKKISAIFFGTPGRFEGLYFSYMITSVSMAFVTISAAICLYKIFISRQYVRNIAVAHYIVSAITILASFWSFKIHTVASINAGIEPEFQNVPVKGMVPFMIWICFWCAYFVFSKRVANTFEGGR